MTAEIQHFANQTTPESVQVPKTMAGLIVWAVGQFGAGAIIGLLCVIAVQRVYEDSKVTQERVMELVREQARLQQQTLSTLEAMRLEIHEAHTRALSK